MTNWYRLPHKTARSLVLIISRSSSVIKLTAGKLFHLSIATFGDVSVNKSILCFCSQIHFQNVLGNENLHDISKHAPNYDRFLDNKIYTILYKALANFLVTIIISYYIWIIVLLIKYKTSIIYITFKS